MDTGRVCRTALVFCALAAPTASAAPAPGTTVEEPIVSAAPDAQQVRASYVRVYDPLPESSGAHPEACDWIGYVRFRSAKGPRRSQDADAIIVIIPGFLGGAGSFDQVARNTVRTAAERGRPVEYWSLDRRANCLEDHHGVHAAARARNASVAYDYYWNGREVEGRRFEGFKTATDAGFLGEFGLERTTLDWNTIMQRGIPRQRQRARKVICGGHSLGGPLTAAYASWDFDGNPDTLTDAGYNQCAGLVGLDTTLDISGADSGAPGSSSAIGLVGQSGGAPFIDAPPLTPETIQIPSVFGVGAFYQPDGTNLLRDLPHTTNIDLSQKLLFSRDAVNFATGMPSIRDFTITNETTLAGVLDDNSAPLSFLRASVGFVTGGPSADKNFPGPSGGFLSIPEEPKTPLYSWLNYDEVGANGASIELNDSGEPFTSREGEVSDISQLARAAFEGPADFVEQYFPTRILLDVVAAEGGDRSGSLSGLKHDGPSKKPALLIQAGDSDDNSPDDRGQPKTGEPPNDKPLSREVIIPGYNHLDVATAARAQNDGRPEPSSTALADFVLEVVPAPGIRLAVRPRRVLSGDAVRVRFHARSGASRCRRRVLIRIGGRRVRTNRRGRASLKLRLPRSGRKRVTARKLGCRPGKAALRVLKPTH
jgi:hypothetical protein